MATDYKTLNDTLEEQLRRELVDLNNQCRNLSRENELLRNEVKHLEEAKYKAYQKIAELTSEVNINKNN